MWRRFKRLPKKLQVIYSLIVLVILFGVGVFIWAIAVGKITPLAAPGEASLSLQSDSSTYKPGVTFTVYINLDTGGTEVSEVALRSFNYNTSVLDVVDQDEASAGVQVAPGSLGDLAVLENSVETTTGKVTYVAKTPDANGLGFSGAGTVAIIYFSAKAAGTSNLNFDFTSGTIGDTDVIAKAGGNDILTSAVPMNITVAGNESHSVCDTSSQTCQTMSGAGANQCSSDIDCQVAVEHHHVCNAAKRVCLKVSGAGANECVTYSDCLKPSPTPASPSPTPEPSETSPPENLPSPTPTEVALVTPTSEIISSPTPIESLFPSEFTPSPETKVAGFGISTTWALILFIGVPVLITATIFVIWWWRKKKKGQFEPPEGREDIDDDEMI